jgi:hypothetical protein
VSISGGTFRGGEASGSNAYGGSALFTDGGANISISGGSFLGGVATGTTGGSGAALALAAEHNSTTVTITGGVFSNGKGRDSLDIFAPGQSMVNISGGCFRGDMNFNLGSSSSVNFYGSNLNYDKTTGLLTGTLDDGKLLDLHVSLGNILEDHTNVSRKPGGTEISFAVPEPSSLILITIGIGAVIIGSTRHRLANRSRHTSSIAASAGQRP